MQPEEIKDCETLEAWLETRSREECIWVAHRAAARVAPLWFQSGKAEWAQKHALTSLLVLRPLIISGVASTYLIPAISIAVEAASASPSAASDGAVAAFAVDTDAIFNAAASFSSEAAAFAAEAIYAASAASAASFSVEAAAFSAADAVASEGDASEAAIAAIWKIVRNDCFLRDSGEKFAAVPLWLDQPNPFDAQWQATRTEWQAPNSPYRFWLRWYEAALQGQHLNLDLEHDIALIPSEDWEKGPDNIATQIDALEAPYRVNELIRANPYAMGVKMDRRQQKLVAFPVEVTELDTVIKAIRTAIKDFSRRCETDRGGNRSGEILLRACTPAIDDLRRDLKRYRKIPLPLFDAVKDACKELAHTAAHNGLADAPALQRMLVQLDRHAAAMVANTPTLLDTLKGRNRVEFELLKASQLIQAISLCTGMAADSDGWLLATALAAIQILNDPERSAEERQSAFYFMKAMIPRGAKAKLESSEGSAKPGQKSKLKKAAEIGDAIINRLLN